MGYAPLPLPAVPRQKPKGFDPFREVAVSKRMSSAYSLQTERFQSRTKNFGFESYHSSLSSCCERRIHAHSSYVSTFPSVKDAFVILVSLGKKPTRLCTRPEAPISRAPRRTSEG